MKRPLLFFLAALAGWPALAQNDDSAPSEQFEEDRGSRFLLVVDTSSSMERMGHESRQAVFDLIYYGVDQQMRPGDTCGLWTFNKETSAGVFPMQVWDPDKTLELASRASLFLKAQPYEHKAQITPLVSKLLAVISAVQDVNIFIISDGETPVFGLPAEQEINAEYSKRSKEARRNKSPIITTLIMRKGDLAGWSVTFAGEPIALPERPPPGSLKPKSRLDLSLGPNPAVRKHQGVAPRVRSSTNRFVRDIPMAQPPSPRPKPPALPPLPQVTTGTLDPGRSPVYETSDYTNVLGGHPDEPVEVEMVQKPGETPATAIAPEPATTAPPASLQEIPSTPLPALNAVGSHKPSEEESNSAPPAIASTSPPASTNDASSAGPTPSRVDPSVADQNASAPLESIPGSLFGALPGEITVNARERSAENPTVKPVAAMTGPPRQILSARELMIAGVALVAVAASLVIVFWRRGRPALQASLISQSMDEQR